MPSSWRRQWRRAAATCMWTQPPRTRRWVVCLSGAAAVIGACCLGACEGRGRRQVMAGGAVRWIGTAHWAAWACCACEVRGMPAACFASHWSCSIRRPRLQFDALTKYGIDLTAKAAELDPVIG